MHHLKCQSVFVPPYKNLTIKMHITEKELDNDLEHFIDTDLVPDEKKDWKVLEISDDSVSMRFIYYTL